MKNENDEERKNRRRKKTDKKGTLERITEFR
jgi:hypothetical protein